LSLLLIPGELRKTQKGKMIIHRGKAGVFLQTQLEKKLGKKGGKERPWVGGRGGETGGLWGGKQTKKGGGKSRCHGRKVKPEGAKGKKIFNGNTEAHGEKGETGLGLRFLGGCEKNINRFSGGGAPLEGGGAGQKNPKGGGSSKKI